MNTNQLKKFAQEARRKLLEQVGAKLAFVLTTDSAELREKSEQVKQLREELNRTNKEQLVEKVAYTWFNRLMALRFMDANDYQPLGIRVITPKDGYTTPELLDEAKRGNIPEELKLKRQRVYDILDNRIPSSNPQNEAYKELLIASCNHLNSTFPFLFEKISDYTELLLPDDLTSDFSIVTDIRKGMHIEDCINVEIIGWLYQFYISEKKDEVFASKSKVKKEDIPAATQLFTPRWIVEYMVQNTLGKLWIQNRPKSKLRENMPYFIESASLTSDDYLKISSPEEIKLLDPASGSGHILVYAFDLFTKIYEEEGYSNNDIPKLIIEKNLFGFEIDERAAQLSCLAIMMKAREYQRRVFKKDFQPNILCYQDLKITQIDIKGILNALQIKVSEDLMYDLLQMQHATNFGSLIIPLANINEITQVLERFNQPTFSSDVFQRNAIDAVQNALIQLSKLAERYHCLAANPPYMGSGNMNKDLLEFVQTNYPDSKADLMACFMESGVSMLYPKGFLGMINQHTWMFISSYEALRKKLIKHIFIDTLLHLGARTFPEIGGEIVQNASFSIWKNTSEKNGTFLRLVDFENSEQKRFKTIEAIQNPDCGWFYYANQRVFEKIPSCTIGYWLSKTVITNFNEKYLNYFADVKKGLSTGSVDRFMKFWHEIQYSKIHFHGANKVAKWFPYMKGGEFRRWAGNQEYVVNWEGDGFEIKNFRDEKGKQRSRPQNIQYYFRDGITYSALTNYKYSVRKMSNSIFGGGGDAIICKSDEDIYYFLGLLNSITAQTFLRVISPTMNYEVSHILSIPAKISKYDKDIINNLAKLNVNISQQEWDNQETSWSFINNEILTNNSREVEEAFDLYQQYWKNKFTQLHQNEEKLNSQFNEIYGFKDELTPEVLLEDITILHDILDRKALENLNTKLIRDPQTLAVKNYHDIHLPFIASIFMAKFISYSVGCMFGRYSLDKVGLVLANHEETLQDYLQKISKTKIECIFLPDEDNIIPILDSEWFEDDIVARFYQFLKVTFGIENFNKNLAFIEEQLGKDIRKYFIKDFYPDHIKRYKKRPIYWMFSSPKGSFNVLIYMHRYTQDTVSNILNKYLKEFIGKLKTRKEHLQHIQVSGSPAEKTKAIKESDNIDKMLIELQEYERDIMFPLATERISIDLDDGVLVNYNKFGKAVKEVAGLNDAATKKKVREFDWIETTQIR